MEEAGFYKIPLRFDHFFKTRKFEKCRLEDSIARYLHLLIITTREEYDFDPMFGCDIWEHDFEHQQSNEIWADKIARRMEEVLERYENRLSSIKINATISESEKMKKDGFKVAKRLKKQLVFIVNAKLSSTDEPFYFKDTVLLSPFSTD